MADAGAGDNHEHQREIVQQLIMKGPLVSELGPKQMITSVFLVQSKDVRQKKDGSPYLSLGLMDKSGELDAKMWDNVGEVLDSFDRDDFIKVKGETLLYQNRLQLSIHRLTRVADAEVDLADFLPASKRDQREMFAELMAVIASMKSEPLRALLQSIFADPETAAAFQRAPAAKGIHHAWLGGLIEHVLSLVSLAKFCARHYPIVDEDLLVTGVILHDIGKISELRYERSFSYSTPGQLLGHIQIGVNLVEEKARAIPGFPPKLKLLVEHLILSHHGQLEFGSPKVPLFAEAVLLHHLDNLDSKMEAVRGAVEKDRNSTSEWTPFVYALDRQLLDKAKFLSEPEAPAVSGAAPAAKTAARKPQPTLFGEQLMGAMQEDGGK
jgi:3'-5' exoribonuclease